jgi:hypothetical protein
MAMTVKEATRHLLKQLETIGWTVSRHEFYPMAHYRGRVFIFRPRSIIVSPGGTDADWRLPSAKHYVTCMHRLLREKLPA